MHKVFPLRHLPPELCNQLCGYLDPESLANLVCVAPDIAGKLRHRVELDLELSFPPHSRPRRLWPRTFLAQFKQLRNLSFSLPGHSLRSYFSLGVSGADLEALPRDSLRGLCLRFESAIPDHVLSFLPPKLETLIITTCTTITSACVALLPRGLLRLELPKARRITNVGLPHLPPNLTSLNLASADITNEGVANLPRSITILDLSKCENLTPACFTAIPPYTTSLNLIRPLRIATDEDISNLPQLLQSLDFGHNKWISNLALARLPRELKEFSCAWNENISGHSLQSLPITLRSFRLGCSCIPDAFIADLPRGLQILHLDCFGLTSACLALLPPTLTSLSLYNIQNIKNEDIARIKAPLTRLDIPSAKLTPAVLPSLPATLTSFEFHDSIWSSLKNSDIKRLPRRLTTLDVDSNHHLDEKMFEHLPPALRCLHAAKVAINTPSQLGKLPRTITQLRLAGTGSTSLEIWKYIPQDIQYVYLPGACFPLSATPLLPRSLRGATFSIVATTLDGTQVAIHPNDWIGAPESLTSLRCDSSTIFIKGQKDHQIWTSVSRTGRP